ncbi:MAG: hypothetical protein JXB03_01930 [Spirochaetales bacterium]|nr:hypothetical protein [Spirochaetales bacterium]
MIQVNPWQNRIAFEFSHAITDGSGAMVFVRWFMDTYFQLRNGHGFQNEESDRRKTSEMWENAFIRYSRKDIYSSDAMSWAFRPRSFLLPKGQYRIITGIGSASTFALTAKEYDLKLGEYLVSVLFAALQKLAFFETEVQRGILRILVPVDLRRFFPSETIRNFFAFVAPEIDMRLGQRDFREIAHEVRHQMRGSLVPWRLQAHFTRHRKLESNIALRVIPGILKRLFLVPSFPLAGEKKFSASLSNLGRVDFDSQYKDEVRRVLFAPPPSPWTKTNCSVISYGDELVISFGSTAMNRDLEREFFRILVQTGASIRITGGTS